MHAAAAAMRATQLIRSRTRKNLSVELELYQAPVILYNQHDEVDESISSAQLGLAVIVSSSDSTRSIGGITVKRQVLLRRKIPRSLGRWTSWDEIQAQEVQVVGECQVHGVQRYECSIQLPRRLPESRQTHYDQLIHLLTVTVHELAPSYPNHHKHSRHKKASIPNSSSPAQSPNPDNSSSDRRRLAPVPEDEYPRVCTTELERIGGKELDVLAMSKKVFEVVHCSTSHGDVPVLEAQQTLRLADSGKVNVKVHSDLFVLGSTLDLTFDFNDLTLDTTIHAFSVKLIQETCTPVKTALPDLIATTESHQRSPQEQIDFAEADTRTVSSSLRRSGRSRSPRGRTPVLSRLSTLWASFKEKPPTPKSSILDEYVLLSEGTDHFITSQGFGVRPGSHLWRGEAGRNMDQQRHTGVATSASAAAGGESGGGGNEEYIDESKTAHEEVIDEHDFLIRTLSALRVHRKVRLPSEVHQAHASSSTLAPVLAKITHRLAINVIYSVLGQDALGKPLKAKGGSLEEGTMRQATLLFEVGLAPCTIIPSSVQPPSYVHASPASPGTSPTRSPSSRTRRLSTITTRSSIRSFDTHSVSTNSTATTPANSPMSASTHSMASPVHHARAFRASNGLVVSGTRVFYCEDEVEDAMGRHQREKGSCACMIK